MTGKRCTLNYNTGSGRLRRRTLFVDKRSALYREWRKGWVRPKPEPFNTAPLSVAELERFLGDRRSQLGQPFD